MAPRELGAELASSSASNEQPNTIVTRLAFDVSPERAWDALSFYEQITERPPLLLRLLLPVAIGTEGKKSEVGDVATCHYRGGHLVKRVTSIERRRHYEFAVVTQELVIGGGMRLTGGSYELRELAPERTEVELATRYVSSKRPRWLWRLMEAAVCHLFHRHILRAMRRDAEARRMASERGTLR